MSAYNRLDGEFCAHNRRLLTDILRDEWGFDGFVVSDWYGVHDATGAANAGLNLEMPGPVRIYGNKLAAAVERGEVTEAQVDRLVRDLLVLANRTKADERSADDPEQSIDDPAERALTRRAAIAGTVLLRNDAGRRIDGPALRRHHDPLDRDHRAQCVDRSMHGRRFRQPHPVRSPHVARGDHRSCRPRHRHRRNHHLRTRRAHRSTHTGGPQGDNCCVPTASPACACRT